MTLFQRIAAVALIAIAAAAAAQTSAYPAQPVRVIVTTVPGPLDTFARIICDKLAGALKQPFVIENKAGAGGNIGAEIVAKSPADGYTLLFALDTTFTVNPSIYKTMAFDVAKHLVVISVTVAEAGYPGFDASFAYALLAPAGTPEEIVRTLAREVKNAMAAPDVREKNRLADYAATDLDPKQSAQWLKDKREHWARVVQRAGIMAQ